MSNYHNQAAEKLEKIQSTPSAKRQLSAKSPPFGTFGTPLGVAFWVFIRRSSHFPTGRLQFRVYFIAIGPAAICMLSYLAQPV